jgi:hypothetical protein
MLIITIMFSRSKSIPTLKTAKRRFGLALQSWYEDEYFCTEMWHADATEPSESHLWSNRVLLLIPFFKLSIYPLEEITSSMKVLIAGCILAGLATAFSLVTKFKGNNNKMRENIDSNENNDDDGSNSIKLFILQRRGQLDRRLRSLPPTPENGALFLLLNGCA